MTYLLNILQGDLSTSQFTDLPLQNLLYGIGTAKRLETGQSKAAAFVLVTDGLDAKLLGEAIQ